MYGYLITVSNVVCFVLSNVTTR